MTPRLWIEYAALALLLGIGGLAVTLKMQTYRQQISINNLNVGLDNEKDAREQAEAVNKVQDEVIHTLAVQRKTDSAAVTQLLDTYKSLKDADTKLRDKLANVEANNADAKAYLDITVPDSVGCLYDDSCLETNGSRTDKGGKDPAAVSTAKNVLLAPEPKAQNSKGGYGKLPVDEGSGKGVQSRP